MEKNRDLMENLYDRQCEMYNVGAMMPWMDYTPRTLDEIIEGFIPEQSMDFDVHANCFKNRCFNDGR